MSSDKRSQGTSRSNFRVSGIPAVILLVVRGALLWVVIPAATVWWLLAMLARGIRRRRYVGLGQTIGWADLNLLAVLRLGRSPFVSWSKVPMVNHRVSLIDPL
jgi:hypothetical protein